MWEHIVKKYNMCVHLLLTDQQSSQLCCTHDTDNKITSVDSLLCQVIANQEHDGMAENSLGNVRYFICTVVVTL